MLHYIGMTQTSLSSNGHTHAATTKKHGAETADAEKKASSNFMLGLTLNLSWQLMFAVLLPILSGHFLDQKLDTSPWFTVGGFALAMVLMIVVVKRMLKDLNEYMGVSKTDDSSENKAGKK